MDHRARIYEEIASRQLETERQMVLLSGPRQVGKTTTARVIAERFPRSLYLDWDEEEARRLILAGQRAVGARAGAGELADDKPLVIFDEIHKFAEWKNFLKGFFDRYETRVRVLVTGSARLDVYRRGSDSLMGRYFPYRMHPLSVAELLDPEPLNECIRPPRSLDDDAFEALLLHGGFPEPLWKGSKSFSSRWRRTRGDLLFREDLRDGTGLQDLARVRMLAVLLEERAGQLCSFSSLSRQVRAAGDTVRRWTEVLESFYFCFAVRPWSRNLTRALRKEPKFYLWDWSGVRDPGRRFENLVASALLKAAHAWTDRGLADVTLHFVRDREKREVDFLLVRDGAPWILVEAKSTPSSEISSALAYYPEKLRTEHAFQVVLERPYVEADAFSHSDPVTVPARTFLSQLV